MGNLRRVKQRLILAATVLAAINLALLVYLLWAGSGSPSLQALQGRYSSLQRDVELWQKSNPEKTRADLKQFYADNLPARYSQITQRLDKLIRDAGVQAQTIHYPQETVEKGAPPDVQQIKIETNVTGDYAKVARFINALEQDKMLFIIEKISLTGQQGGVVSLQITFDTFLRQAA